MGTTTAISWTDHTFNPWWGCQRVSPGCEHCYAESFAKRTGHDVWGKGSERRRFGSKHWTEPFKWRDKAEAAGRPAKVFCASMADVFEDRDDHIEDRNRLFTLIELTAPHLIWQLLTKRPENVNRLVGDRWPDGWPENVWMGTTVEDQKRADERIPELLDIPAKVRFLSCEPLLGEVQLARWFWPVEAALTPFPARRIHWVIVGGESGAKHRALDLRHARILKHECFYAGTPFFFKQVGGRTPTAGGDLLDGRTHKEFPR